jgi:hypothetical protein
MVLDRFGHESLENLKLYLKNQEKKKKPIAMDPMVPPQVGTRQLPPLSSVLYGIISGRRSVLAAYLLLREKSGA